VVGFKQSIGTVPQDWAHDAFGNISYVTPMTRTVADTALMLSVMAGPAEADPQTINRPRQDYLAAAGEERGLRGLRLGFRDRLGNPVLGADMRHAFEQAIGTFTEAGAELRECTHEVENVERLWFIVNASYRRAQYGYLIAQHRDIMCLTFLRQMDAAAEYSAAELYDGILMRTRLYRQVQSWLEGLDALLMPTLSRAALPLDQDFFAPIEIDNQMTDTIRRAWYPYTMPFNLTGHPAISVPCGWDRDGLPLGLQSSAGQARMPWCSAWRQPSKGCAPGRSADRFCRNWMVEPALRRPAKAGAASGCESFFGVQRHRCRMHHGGDAHSSLHGFLGNAVLQQHLLVRFHAHATAVDGGNRQRPQLEIHLLDPGLRHDVHAQLGGHIGVIANHEMGEAVIDVVHAHDAGGRLGGGERVGA
jgi:Amidase